MVQKLDKGSCKVSKRGPLSDFQRECGLFFFNQTTTPTWGPPNGQFKCASTFQPKIYYQYMSADGFKISEVSLSLKQFWALTWSNKLNLGPTCEPPLNTMGTAIAICWFVASCFEKSPRNAVRWWEFAACMEGLRCITMIWALYLTIVLIHKLLPVWHCFLDKKILEPAILS